MKINLSIIALGIFVIISTAWADDQDSSGQPMPSSMGASQPLSDQHFVWATAITDWKEIKVSELALQKTENNDVKKFAQKIIRDHMKASKKLQSIAEKKGLNYPDTNSLALNMSDRWISGNPTSVGMDNTNSPMIGGSDHHILKGAELLALHEMETNMDNDIAPGMTLEMLSGAEFDRAYASKMVKGHEKAISTFEVASANLPDRDLKKYADKTLPTLREHLRMAQELQSKVGIWQNSGMTNSMSQNQ